MPYHRPGKPLTTLRNSCNGGVPFMYKTAAPSNLSECIVQSLLLLLQDKAIDEISVKEIVEKAGVNRSTYYRHFRTKIGRASCRERV